MPSLSEDQGIACLKSSDQKVYSIGISTRGSAEIRMAKLMPTRHIIATTLDKEGANFVEKEIEKLGFARQITIKIEDVAKPLPYPDGYFDFIYARLSLHYLSKTDLVKALSELHRIVKLNGILFCIVRSTASTEANIPEAIYDPGTGFTTYPARGKIYKRHFHTEESIQEYLQAAHFHIESVHSYEEQLFMDFHRSVPSSHIDVLIEVIATATN